MMILLTTNGAPMMIQVILRTRGGNIMMFLTMTGKIIVMIIRNGMIMVTLLGNHITNMQTGQIILIIPMQTFLTQTDTLIKALHIAT